jgi:hypothetical protein
VQRGVQAESRLRNRAAHSEGSSLEAEVVNPTHPTQTGLGGTAGWLWVKHGKENSGHQGSWRLLGEWGARLDKSALESLLVTLGHRAT